MTQLKKFIPLVFLFTLLSCGVSNVSNNLYEIYKQPNTYKFVWKGWVKRSADKQIWFPLNYRIELPAGLKSYDSYDRFIILKFKHNQTLIIKNSYLLEGENIDISLKSTDFSSVDALLEKDRKKLEIRNLVPNNKHAIRLLENKHMDVYLVNMSVENQTIIENSIRDIELVISPISIRNNKDV